MIMILAIKPLIVQTLAWLEGLKEICEHAVAPNKLPSWTKSPLSGSIVQNSDVANAAAVGGGTCRCLAPLWTFYALLGVIIFCEGVLWALLALGTRAFPRPCCRQEWCCLMWLAISDLLGKGATCERKVCDFWITSKSKTTSSCSICP